ncbi:hypothetical protein niasHT_037476 [Heterodera trifolii]|uniref:Uncharacterized protein n=1 Tax=Heterodera trifolii TaxID=157864 RepID=A0ABD2IXT4_9BILA
MIGGSVRSLSQYLLNVFTFSCERTVWPHSFAPFSSVPLPIAHYFVVSPLFSATRWEMDDGKEKMSKKKENGRWMDRTAPGGEQRVGKQLLMGRRRRRPKAKARGRTSPAEGTKQHNRRGGGGGGGDE